jgi:hypothetical protein
MMPGRTTGVILAEQSHRRRVGFWENEPKPNSQTKILAEQSQSAKAQHCRMSRLASVAQMPRPHSARTPLSHRRPAILLVAIFAGQHQRIFRLARRSDALDQGDQIGKPRLLANPN